MVSVSLSVSSACSRSIGLLYSPVKLLQKKNRGPVTQLRSHYCPHVLIWHAQGYQHHPPHLHTQPLPPSVLPRLVCCWLLYVTMQRWRWGKRSHSASQSDDVHLNLVREAGGSQLWAVRQWECNGMKCQRNAEVKGRKRPVSQFHNFVIVNNLTSLFTFVFTSK